MREVLLGVRFLLELALLAASAYAGWELAGVVAALAAPLAAAALWGVFVSPKAPRRLAPPSRMLLELALFAVAAAGLVAAGRVSTGAAFAAVALADTLAVHALGESR